MAYWIGYAASKYSDRLGDWDWRIVIIFQLLAPIMILVLLWGCPETPRWYVKKDRVEDAARALAMIRDDPQQAQNELHEISATITFENETISAGYSALWKDSSIRRRLCK